MEIIFIWLEPAIEQILQDVVESSITSTFLETNFSKRNLKLSVKFVPDIPVSLKLIGMIEDFASGQLLGVVESSNHGDNIKIISFQEGR